MGICAVWEEKLGRGGGAAGGGLYDVRDVGERSAGRGGGCELKVIMSSIPSTMFVICLFFCLDFLIDTSHGCVTSWSLYNEDLEGKNTCV